MVAPDAGRAMAEERKSIDPNGKRKPKKGPISNRDAAIRNPLKSFVCSENCESNREKKGVFQVAIGIGRPCESRQAVADPMLEFGHVKQDNFARRVGGGCGRTAWG